MVGSDFERDGISFVSGLITDDNFLALQREARFLFSKTLMSGPQFCVVKSPTVREIIQPLSSIYCMNLFELAVDIGKIVNSQTSDTDPDLVLAHAALYSESKNRRELAWHSDSRDGQLIRVQLCLSGSTENSGSFRYIKGSQNILNGPSRPTKEYIAENSGNVVSSPPASGQFSFINTQGYHGKSVCVEERISLMLDFLPRAYVRANPNDCVSSITIRNDQLVIKVLEGLKYLNIGERDLGCSPNTPAYYAHSLRWAGLHNQYAAISNARSTFRALAGRFTTKGQNQPS